MISSPLPPGCPMSEHTPLTKTELGDLAAAYGWWRAHGDPEMFYDTLNDAVARIICDRKAVMEAVIHPAPIRIAKGEAPLPSHDEAANAIDRILAARTSADTADTGLRERIVQAIERRRNEHWQRHLRDHPLSDGSSCPADYAAHDAYRDAAEIARATPASTEDRADNEGTP